MGQDGTARWPDLMRGRDRDRPENSPKTRFGVASSSQITASVIARPSGNTAVLTINLPPILAPANLTMQPGLGISMFSVSIGQTVTIGYNGPVSGLPAPIPYPANAPAGTPPPTNPAWTNSHPSVGLLTPINGGLQATYEALAVGTDALSCVLMSPNGEIVVMLADVTVA